MYKHRHAFGNGLLPNGMEVLDLLLTLNEENCGKQINNPLLCAKDVALQWIFCNVYPHVTAAILRKINTMHEIFIGLKISSKRNPIRPSHWKNYEDFLKTQQTLFDVKGSDDRKKIQQKIWGLI